MEPYEYNPFAPPSAAGTSASPAWWTELALGVVIALIAGIGLVVVATRDVSGPVAADCEQMRDFPLEIDARHSEGLVEYDSDPPYGGQHAGTPLPGPRRAYPRAGAPENIAERAVHNLEHGYVVVWYDAGAPERTFRQLPGRLLALDGMKVIVVPWRGTVRPGRHFTLAAWGHLQTCANPTVDVIRAFYAEHGGENGDAPEKLVG